MSYKCNEDALSLPIVGCDDCSSFEARIKQLEELLEGAVTAIGELQDDVENLQTALEGKQDTLTAGNQISLENNIVSYIKPKQIIFKREKTTVCDATVCESKVCGEFTVNASAEEIVNDIKNNNAQNIAFEFENGETAYADAALVVNETINAYEILFSASHIDEYQEVITSFLVSGDNDGCSYTSGIAEGIPVDTHQDNETYKYHMLGVRLGIETDD